ncbi:MAG TPA: response regulator transcription factor [Baekduia sp.]|nr:response regulator transcription factor [Baekduia sp.]
MSTARPRLSLPAAAPTDLRVVVVAEVRLYRDSLASALRQEPGVDVVAAAAEVPSELMALAPHIVLYDVSRQGALEVVRGLLGGDSPVKVVAVAISDDERELLAFAEAGVSGYVTCEQSLVDVVAAVRAVAREEMICTPRVAAALLRHVAALAADLEVEAEVPHASLTRRELEIVQLIERGMSNKQIARTLHIEVATVKNHVHNVLEKLNVDRRGEAAARLRDRLTLPVHAV